MDSKVLSDPPEDGMNAAHNAVMLFGLLIGGLAVIGGLGGFIYFVLL